MPNAVKSILNARVCLKFYENQGDRGKWNENVQSPSWSGLVLQTYLGHISVCGFQFERPEPSFIREFLFFFFFWFYFSVDQKIQALHSLVAMDDSKSMLNMQDSLPLLLRQFLCICTSYAAVWLQFCKLGWTVHCHFGVHVKGQNWTHVAWQQRSPALSSSIAHPLIWDDDEEDNIQD